MLFLYSVPFTLRWRNLKTEVSLRKRIKCVLSTLAGGNYKRNNHRSFGLVVIMMIVTPLLSKTAFSKCFRLHKIEKPAFENPPT